MRDVLHMPTHPAYICAQSQERTVLRERAERFHRQALLVIVNYLSSKIFVSKCWIGDFSAQKNEHEE